MGRVLVENGTDPGGPLLPGQDVGGIAHQGLFLCAHGHFHRHGDVGAHESQVLFAHADIDAQTAALGRQCQKHLSRVRAASTEPAPW